MSELYPVACLALIASFWVAAALQGHRLYRSFLAKHPVEARKLIPFAGTSIQHPEKILFFFRKGTLPLLRADQPLWTMRQSLKVLLIISVVLPFACFGFLIFQAIAGSR